MKRIISLLLIFTVIYSLNSQEIVVIEDPIYGGYSIPFTDTVISSVDDWSCIGDVYYYVDLDLDSINDILINMQCYWGGNGSSNYIKIESFEKFRTLIDTNFVTTFQNWDFENDTVKEWEDKYTIVKPFYKDDTLTISQESRQDPIVISEYSYGQDSPIPITYIDIDDFVGDTIYIAFRKDDSFTSFYYLKVFIESSYTVHLFSAWSNEMLFGIPNIDSPLVKVLSVSYFDILGREIIKPNRGFYIERTTTSKGIISKKYYIP